MNQILHSKKNQVKTKKMVIISCFFLLLLLIVFSVGFGLSNRKSDKILKGVFLNNLNVGGLTVETANSRLNEKLDKLKDSKITLYLGDYSKTVSGRDLGVKYPEDAVDEAYAYGRTGSLLKDNFTVLSSYFNKKHYVNVDYVVDDARCDRIIKGITNDLSSLVNDDSYEINENKIVLKKGKTGKTIKTSDLKQALTANLTGENIRLEIPMEVGAPKRVNIDELYKEIHVEAKDATFSNENGFEVTKEVYGVEFDKDLAKKEYTELPDGETMEIELLTIEPKVKLSDLNDMLFKDTLATYSTKYDRYNYNRANNLEIAARNINGTILYPGDEFSYNKVVGERTAKNGFKEAHVFSGGRVVDGLGGGICQVSSTLYNTVLLSNLEVTNRAAHMMHTQYVDPGRDATVVWGSIDFKFKNNRTTPVKIETTVKNGVCTVTFYGLKQENEPKVEIESKVLKVIPYTTIRENDPTMNEGTEQVVQSPVNGYESETYKILKDSQGNQISRTLISKDKYQQTSKIIKVGTKTVTPIETPTPTPTSGSSGLPDGWDNPENPYAQ